MKFIFIIQLACSWSLPLRPPPVVSPFLEIAQEAFHAAEPALAAPIALERAKSLHTSSDMNAMNEAIDTFWNNRVIEA